MTPIIGAGGRLSSRAIDRAASRMACVVAHVAWSDEVLGPYGTSSCEDDAYIPYVEGLGIDWQRHRLLSAMPGRRHDGTPVVVVTLTPVRETRTYADRQETLRRVERARARGYVGPGAIARYRADVAEGVEISPAPPPEDVAWARATA